MGVAGDILQGFGPGLLSGIGKALNDSGGGVKHFEPKGSGSSTQGPPRPTPSIPKYHDGTDYVPKTGPAILKKGEAVLNPDDAEDMRENKNMATEKKPNVSLYRAMHHLNKGGLHRALKVPEGEKIPEDKIEAAKNSKNSHVRHMANLASTMSEFKHTGPKK